jgi:chromosome segregation ATPase
MLQLHDEVVHLRAEVDRLRTERNQTTTVCARLARRLETREEIIESLASLAVEYRLRAEQLERESAVGRP